MVSRSLASITCAVASAVGCAVRPPAEELAGHPAPPGFQPSSQRADATQTGPVIPTACNSVPIESPLAVGFRLGMCKHIPKITLIISRGEAFKTRLENIKTVLQNFAAICDHNETLAS